MRASWNVALAAMAAVAFLASGCADPYAGRLALSGEVKLKGEPIKAGVIMFEPLEKQDTSSGASIENGKYDIPRKQGLKAGRYRVRVTAGDGVTPARPVGGKKGQDEEQQAAGPGGSRNIVSVDLIPPSWGADSRQEITLDASKTNRFDFNIPAK